MKHDNDTLRLVSGDKPLDSLTRDRLGYAPFARYLATALTQTSSQEGLVLGLYGEWGSGKSTLINFLIEAINENDNEAKRTFIIKFNPWWYSGQANLVSRFLREFLYTLSKLTRVSDALREGLAGLADSLGDLELKGLGLGIGKLVATVVKPNRSVEDLREKVASGLEKFEGRILVIVDDVDRLHRDEIMQLFLAIKAIANFPHTNYILAMDKRVVARALADAGFGNGEDFLEKIIQVPLDLPEPDRSALEGFLIEQLNQIFGQVPEGLFDKERWGLMFLRGVSPLLRTPRHVVRLVNSLSVVYPVVAGEVNVVDLIGLEVIRSFFYPIYQIIRNYPAKFLNTGEFYEWAERGSKREEWKEFHQGWADKIPELQRPTARYLVSYLFPKVASVWSTRTPEIGASRARRELLICAPERFPVYFRLSIAASEFQAAEVAHLLEIARHPDAFSAKLIALSNEINPDGTSRARSALERLGDIFEEKLAKDIVIGAIVGLLEASDTLVGKGDSRRNFFDMDNSFQVGRCLYLLSRQLEQEEFAALLEKVVQQSSSLTLLVEEIASLAREYGQLESERVAPPEEQRIALSSLECLKDNIVERIRREAAEETLATHPLLSLILYRWRDWGGESEVKSWVTSFLDTRRNVPIFIAGFKNTRRSSMSGTIKIEVTDFIGIEGLKSLTDLGTLTESAEGLLKDPDLKEGDRAILEIFLRDARPHLQ